MKTSFINIIIKLYVTCCLDQSFVNLTLATVSEEASTRLSVGKSVGHCLDWMWEGPVPCGQCHARAGGPGWCIRKQAKQALGSRPVGGSPPVSAPALALASLIMVCNIPAK